MGESERKILDALATVSTGATANEIQKLTGVNSEAIQTALSGLENNQLVEFELVGGAIKWFSLEKSNVASARMQAAASNAQPVSAPNQGSMSERVRRQLKAAGPHGLDKAALMAEHKATKGYGSNAIYAALSAMRKLRSIEERDGRIYWIESVAAQGKSTTAVAKPKPIAATPAATPQPATSEQVIVAPAASAEVSNIPTFPRVTRLDGLTDWGQPATLPPLATPFRVGLFSSGELVVQSSTGQHIELPAADTKALFTYLERMLDGDATRLTAAL